MVLTSGCHVVISRRYHTRQGSDAHRSWILGAACQWGHFYPPLTSSSCFCLFTISPSSSSPSHVPSLYLSLLSPSIFFCLFFFLSPFCSAFSSPPSIHPHGSNSLSGLSHSLQASRQSLQRLEQQTNSFKQHYIGLA